MIARFLRLTVVFSAAAFFAPAGPIAQVSTPPSGVSAGAPATVSRIEFDGNRRVQSETLKAFIFTRPGDPYSEEAVQRDVVALRNTRNFEQVRLEVRDQPGRSNAKIVIFHFTERPIIRRIEYHGLVSVTESELLNSLKERKVDLELDSPFDSKNMQKAEVVIKELETEHGHQSAVVKSAYENIAGANAVTLSFTVDEVPPK